MAATVPSALAAGKIVINHDEWTFSSTGFGGQNDAGTFATNVAAFFTGGTPGSFLAYSSNFGLSNPALNTAMNGAGHTWTVSMAQPFTLATLSAYDGVFIGGNTLNNQVLIDYVNAGGNVYIMGGTGSINETTVFGPFLAAFGFSFGSPYNGLCCSIAISSSHPLFANVDHLYENNGSSITDLAPLDPQNEIIFSRNGQGTYAVFNGSGCAVAPDGDLNANGGAKGDDVQPFVLALVNQSNLPNDVCHADFSASGHIDTLDLPGFVAKLLGA